MASNVYYNPEHWGLTKIDELENSTGCYEFDTHILLQHENGTLYYCQDAGCSCPTPFEGYNLTNMTIVTKEGFESFRDSMFNMERDHCTIGEINAFVDSARQALKMKKKNIMYVVHDVTPIEDGSMHYRFVWGFETKDAAKGLIKYIEENTDCLNMLEITEKEI